MALDGNHHSLRFYEKILSQVQSLVNFQIDNHPAALMIDDFYDLDVLDNVLNKQFDIIVSFKAICEFVTKDQFEKQNAYEHITKFLMPKLDQRGLLLYVDVTTYNNTSQEWLPIMMDKGLNVANCSVTAKNNGYNQTFLITHSRHANDKSKVAWRMIKH